MFKKLNKAFLFVVFALSLIKAQDVSIAVGDTAFAGYTDDIVVPITLSNPNGNIGVINSITAGSDIKIGFELDLPLHFRLEDAKRTDTLDIDFGGQYVDLTEVDYLDSVIFKLHTENEFPLDIDLMILFTDSMSGLILDSLDIQILDAAQVDEDGRTISANIYDSNIILNHAQIDALFNSNRALLDIKMNSHDNENSAVKLYTDYQFNISAGAIFELNID